MNHFHEKKIEIEGELTLYWNNYLCKKIAIFLDEKEEIDVVV